MSGDAERARRLTYELETAHKHAAELQVRVEYLEAGIKRVLPSKPGKWSEGAGNPDDLICLLMCQIEFLEDRVADLEDEKEAT